MSSIYSDYYLLEAYPDELFFSRVARTVRLLSTHQTYQAMKHYFKRRIRHPVTLYPFDLYEDPLEVFNQSVFPYYMSFMPLKRQKALKESGFFTSSKDSHYGLVRYKSRTKQLVRPELSYCPYCLKEEIESLGMPYFHVSHQLAGAFACPIHGTKLVEYIPDQFTTLYLLTPSDIIETKDASAREILYSKWASGIKGLSLEYLKAVYHTRIFQKDPKLFNKKYFAHNLIDFFGKDYLSEVGCFYEDHPNKVDPRFLTLLSAAYSYQRITISPFYHLMMWEFLGLSPDDLTDPVFVRKEKNHYIPVFSDRKTLMDSGCSIYNDLGMIRYGSTKEEVLEFFPLDYSNFF